MSEFPNLNCKIMSPIASFGYDLLFLSSIFQHNATNKNEIIINKLMEIINDIATSYFKIIQSQKGITKKRHERQCLLFC